MAVTLPSRTVERAKAAAGAPALEFDRVTLRPMWPYDTALDEVSFEIRPGELTLVTLAAGRVRSPFADLAQGLIDPHGGQVRVGGRSWTAMSPTEMARVRSRIGRVFDVGGWVSNLDVDENVLLAQRHHNRAPVEVLRSRADELARGFKLEGVPTRRPAEASQNELRLSQWVRALLVDMSLLVLERPTRDVQPEAIGPFLEAIRNAREKGAAVIWVTTDGVGMGQNVAPPEVTARYSVRGLSLMLESNPLSS
jgi:ABC-type multidrug transport system ATPase subunit